MFIGHTNALETKPAMRRMAELPCASKTKTAVRRIVELPCTFETNRPAYRRAEVLCTFKTKPAILIEMAEEGRHYNEPAKVSITFKTKGGPEMVQLIGTMINLGLLTALETVPYCFDRFV